MAKPNIDISQLSPEQRLELLEELWDSLSGSPDALALTNAQREELDRRIDERFPYSVLYRLKADHLIIVGCFHSKRDPKSWQARH